MAFAEGLFVGVVVSTFMFSALGICLTQIALRDLKQSRQETDKLRAGHDECRRLLREAILRDGIVDDRWFKEARKAGGEHE